MASRTDPAPAPGDPPPSAVEVEAAAAPRDGGDGEGQDIFSIVSAGMAETLAVGASARGAATDAKAAAGVRIAQPVGARRRM